jgi:recombination protein RecA
VAAFIDAEHALDPTWARKLGVNLDDLLVSQPDTGEQALEICELLVRSNAVDVIVVDSVAALIPRAEIEGEMGDSTSPAGPADEPGAAQADGRDRQDAPS